jgi:predicted acetyltransferase
MTGLDDLVIRHLAVDELEELVRLEALVWGWQADAGRLPWYREFLAPQHTMGVFQAGRLVATHGITAQRLTVPGGGVVDLAGCTCLVVHPLARHRGLMSVLTTGSFDLARRAGLALAGGMPIHSRTHLRYGYGYATRYAQVELDLDGQRQLRDTTADGRLENVDDKAALVAMHELAERLVGTRNGWMPRAACTNAYKYAGANARSGEYGPMAFVLHRSRDAAVDGLLGYRVSTGADEYGRPRGTLAIAELFGTSAEAEAQLWRYCLENPLVSRITATRRPVRDPITARLADPHAWRQVVRDDMVLRVLDVGAALSARRYAREDTVVLKVHDVPGRFELAGGLDAASCQPTGAGPDITLTLSALGSAYLGDITLADLAAAGQVTEHTPGSLRRASAMFSWSPAPWVQDAV